MISRPLFCLFILCGILWSVSIFGCADDTAKFPGKDAKATDTVRPGPPPGARSGGIYRIPLANNPSTLDPALVEDQYGTMVVNQLFNRLVTFGDDLLVEPGLAESWIIEDGGRTYRFTLRDNVLFHDGATLTAQDVVFSLLRLFQLDPAPSILPHLMSIVGAQEYCRKEIALDQVGIHAVDDRTVVIRLNEPHLPLLAALGTHQASILPREAVMRLGPGFSKAPVGSGPFKLRDWTPGKAIVLQRFDGYFEGPRLLDELHFIIYPGGKADRIMADFKSGRLEEMPVYGAVRDEIAAMPHVQRLTRPSLSLFFYGLNTAHPNLSDLDVRKNLLAALDRARLVKEVYAGQYQLASGALPPGIQGYEPGQVPSPASQAAFKAHAPTAHGPKRIELVSAIHSPITEAEMAIVAEDWAKVGVELSVRYITDWKAFEKYISSSDVQVYRYVWFADMPDPHSVLGPLFSSDSKVNYTNYHNPAFDALLTRAKAEADPVARAVLYAKLDKLVMRDAPIIPLFYLNVDQAYQSYVKGIRVGALGAQYASLHQVWLDQK